MEISVDIIGKTVAVTSAKGNNYSGHIDDICPEYDSDDGKRGIYLSTPKEQIYLSESDIKSLEVIA